MAFARSFYQMFDVHVPTHIPFLVISFPMFYEETAYILLKKQNTFLGTHALTLVIYSGSRAIISICLRDIDT